MAKHGNDPLDAEDQAVDAVEGEDRGTDGEPDIGFDADEQPAEAVEDQQNPSSRQTAAGEDERGNSGKPQKNPPRGSWGVGRWFWSRGARWGCWNSRCWVRRLPNRPAPVERLRGGPAETAGATATAHTRGEDCSSEGCAETR